MSCADKQAQTCDCLHEWLTGVYGVKVIKEPAPEVGCANRIMDWLGSQRFERGMPALQGLPVGMVCADWRSRQDSEGGVWERKHWLDAAWARAQSSQSPLHWWLHMHMCMVTVCRVRVQGTDLCGESVRGAGAAAASTESGWSGQCSLAPSVVTVAFDIALIVYCSWFWRLFCLVVDLLIHCYYPSIWSCCDQFIN